MHVNYILSVHKSICFVEVICILTAAIVFKNIKESNSVAYRAHNWIEGLGVGP